MLLKAALQNTSKIEWDLAIQPNFQALYTKVSNDDLLKLQKALFDIFIDFHDFCEKHQIDYAIVAGTLIGAVRHKGFIPWDDDIDLILPRPDYEKLANLFSTDNYFSEKYVFITPETDKEISLCAKLALKNQSLKDLLGDNYSSDDLIYIDLLPVDRIPKNKALQKIIGMTVNVLTTSYASLRCWKKYSPHLNFMATQCLHLRINLFLRKILSLPSCILGKHLSLKLIHSLLKIGNSNQATIGLGAKKYFGEIIEYNDFFPSTTILFENKTVRAPMNFDKYLTNRYGNYMQVPEKKEQMERLVRLKGNWSDFK